MTKGIELKKPLDSGKVYRRKDLIKYAGAFERHLVWLVADGTLVKVGHGLYYYPEQDIFGSAPLEDKIVIRTFLKTDPFLLTSPHSYQALGLGTIALYSLPVVYNHRLQGIVELDGRKFFFRKTSHFPLQTTAEFLLVDLVNQLDTLVGDRSQILDTVMARARTMDVHALGHAVNEYGHPQTQELFSELLDRRGKG